MLLHILVMFSCFFIFSNQSLNIINMYIQNEADIWKIVFVDSLETVFHIILSIHFAFAFFAHAKFKLAICLVYNLTYGNQNKRVWYSFSTKPCKYICMIIFFGFLFYLASPLYENWIHCFFVISIIEIVVDFKYKGIRKNFYVVL